MDIDSHDGVTHVGMTHVDVERGSSADQKSPPSDSARSLRGQIYANSPGLTLSAAIRM